MPGKTIWTALGLGLAVLVSGSSPAVADSCREWNAEHRDAKARAIGLYLHGAPEREVETALFELAQLEAYLTACDLPPRLARCKFVGWRMSDRPVDEFAQAPLESLLEEAGFKIDLSTLFDAVPTAAPIPIRAARRAERR